MKKIQIYAAFALLSLNTLVFICGVALKLSADSFYKTEKANMILKSALVYASRDYEDFGRKTDTGREVDIRGVKAAFIIKEETKDFISITISTRLDGKSYSKKFISKK